MSKWLILDVETTTSNKGMWSDPKNKLVNVGLKWRDEDAVIIYMDEDNVLDRINTIISEADFIVGFNLKFDLHWLINAGVSLVGKKLWDCQLFEYSRLYQRHKYISLNETAERWGLPTKLDVVKLEYWDKGIDTDQIPRDVLSEYLEQDLVVTEAVLEKQLALRELGGHRPTWFNTFRLDCVDLWSIIEMERAGTLVDLKGLEIEKQRQYDRKRDLELQLRELAKGVPINLGSNDHVSCLLFGGNIVEEQRLPIGVYKSGAKVGQVRYQLCEYIHTMPRIFEPVPKTELKKVRKDADGKEIHKYYSTSEDVLLKVKTKKVDKWIIEALIELGKIDKLIGSYLDKIPKDMEKYGWKDDYLYGSFNHGITLTGRLASEKPNLQNISPEVKKYMPTRFKK